MSVKIFLVEGMTCKHCTGRVEKRIGEIPGVEEVIADLATGQVSIEGHSVTAEMVKVAVEEAGYTFKGGANGPLPGSDLWLS
jgi:copper chaperone CopZ